MRTHERWIAKEEEWQRTFVIDNNGIGTLPAAGGVPTAIVQSAGRTTAVSAATFTA